MIRARFDPNFAKTGPKSEVEKYASFNNLRPMKIRLVMVGRTERGFVEEGIRHYRERVSRTWGVEEAIIAATGKGDPAHQQRTEGERLLAALKPGEKVIALDELGRTLGSTAFAKQLGAWQDQGARQVAFLIGGGYGLSDAVRERADLILSLSAMTFPHQLVRILLMEQIYRANSILHGSGYHH